MPLFNTRHRLGQTQSRFGLLICAFVMAGCATVSARNTGVPLDESGKRSADPRTKSGLVITGEELGAFASRYFGAVRVTFENPSAHWVHIRKMRLSFGSAERNQSVLLPWGAQVGAWMEATMRRNTIHRANVDTALALVAVSGYAVHLAAGDGTVGKLGALAAGGATAVSAVDTLSTPARLANSPPLFPESHLLAVPFSIPPGLFADRWVLLQTPDTSKSGCLRTMILDYETEDGGRERVVLPFRSRQEWSEWQTRECRTPAPRSSKKK